MDLRSAPRAATAVATRWSAALASRWRRSLQLRVVATTMLLGLIVVGGLGSILLNRIVDGIVQDRVASALHEAARGAKSAQDRFDTADQPTAVGLNQLVTDLLPTLANPGPEQQRGVALLRVAGSAGPPVISDLVAGNLAQDQLPVVLPADLRAAVDKSEGQQQYRFVSFPDRSGGVPAVAVGSKVSIPVAGQYGLYFVFRFDNEEKTLTLVRGALVAGGAVLVLLVGAVAWVVTRQVVVPVRGAAQIAVRLASGRLDERLRVKGEDDLARLAASFNEMADSLQHQIRQLEELSVVQRRFVSDVSHELRTPLTTIRMAGEVLHESRHDFPPAVARSAELLQTQLDRFESLLGDLLEISRFDAGAAKADVEPADLRDVVTRAVETAAPLAERRGSALQVRMPAEPAIAEVDPRRVERILRNLVVNAVEHGEGGPVEIELGVDDQAVAVVVTDHGVGLRPGEAALVFDRFWRGDPARARTTGGTGLGLSISLEDARLHGGWLQATGRPGQGARFRLTLPRRQGQGLERSPLPLRAPTPAVRTVAAVARPGDLHE